MSRVAVVTDTTQYLPAEVLARHGISLVSLYVTQDGRTRREDEITDYAAFYGALRTARDLPTTSQPSVGDFLEVWEPLLDDGANVVSVHLSSALSGTCQAAERARQDLLERGVEPGRITVVDSELGAAGHGLLAVAAANAAAAGADAAGAAARALELRSDLKIWFAVDSLDYLRRGGRIGGAQAWLGSALRIKPILTIEREVVPIERVRTAGRAHERLVAFLQTRRDEGADAFIVQHIQAPEQAERLAARGREIYGCEPVILTEIGPVFGAHLGPGVVGTTGLSSALLGPV